MSADRQQRRQRKRQLLQLGDAATKRGLPVAPGKEQILGLALLIRETLMETSEDRASRAAAIVHKVFEASLKATPARMEIACRKGCGYCCHSWVAATAPELMLIARTLQSDRTGSSARNPTTVLARAAKTIGLDVAKRYGAKIPCAFLIDSACSVYRERPTVCRQVTSSSLSSCIEEYEGLDSGGEVVVSRVFLDHASNCRIPLQAALHSVQRSIATYELGAGITMALKPGAELSWLSGSDPFANAARAPEEPAPVLQAIRWISGEIALL